MEAEILKILDEYVLVKTQVGIFKGKWCSPNPVLNKKYIIELENDDVLTDNQVTTSSESKPYIRNIENFVYVNGVLEELQDGVMIFRIQNSILMLSVISENAFLQFLGKQITVRLGYIELYDTGI